MNILIKNGRVIDPANNIDGVLDVLVEGKKIAKVAKSIERDEKSPRNSHFYKRGERGDLQTQEYVIIDAFGKLVLPGLVDMHTHLREPGREDKETIGSGARAALKGGVTSVLAMPNTDPPVDSVENVRLLKGIIQNNACVNVYIAAAITLRRQGKQVSDIPALKRCGIIAISDDGASVDDRKVFAEALKKARAADILVICHCEDKRLSDNGVVNAGFISTKLGLRGISPQSEYKRVKRDIELARDTGAKIHIAHVSVKESVGIIAAAKKKKIKVTAETAPHYFSLTEEAVCGYDPNMKMNPPLRTAEDAEAIKQALRDGIIDAIASDHAPHTENEKDIEFDRAEFGVTGLETELAVSITELVDRRVLDWAGLVEKMSLNPARILGINKGTLSPGSDADIIVVDANKEWTVRKEGFASKSKNSAFIGRRLKGVVERVICGGQATELLIRSSV